MSLKLEMCVHMRLRVTLAGLFVKIGNQMGMKKALRETQTLRARALAVVRFGHRPPARPLSQTHRQDRLQYTAPQLGSAQCNDLVRMGIKYCGGIPSVFSSNCSLLL